MNLSAQPDNAGDSKRSRFDFAWLKLIIPIGTIVVVAVICLVIAILTSARRADEMAVKREQQLIQQAIVERGARMLRQVESVATTDRAAQALREKFDPQWVDEHLGHWLENFFDHDLVVIVDSSDRVEYARSRAGGDIASMPLPRALAAIRDFVRGRIDAAPAGALPVIAPPDAGKPSHSAGWIEQVMGKPAIVMAVAIGSEKELVTGNASAPIVLSVSCCKGSARTCNCPACALPRTRVLPPTAM